MDAVGVAAPRLRAQLLPDAADERHDEQVAADQLLAAGLAARDRAHAPGRVLDLEGRRGVLRLREAIPATV